LSHEGPDVEEEIPTQLSKFKQHDDRDASEQAKRTSQCRN